MTKKTLKAHRSGRADYSIPTPKRAKGALAIWFSVAACSLVMLPFTATVYQPPEPIVAQSTQQPDMLQLQVAAREADPGIDLTIITGALPDETSGPVEPEYLGLRGASGPGDIDNTWTFNESVHEAGKTLFPTSPKTDLLTKRTKLKARKVATTAMLKMAQKEKARLGELARLDPAFKPQHDFQTKRAMDLEGELTMISLDIRDADNMLSRIKAAELQAAATRRGDAL